MSKNVYIDLHVLETVPPSCVNRDDTGSPKTAVYGGTVRARVSSQCWKHAMREYFKKKLSQEDVGCRTKRVLALVADAIHERNPKADAEALAEAALNAAKIIPKAKAKKKGAKKETEEEGTDQEDAADNGEKETEALFFISPSQIAALADAALTVKKLDKETCEKALMASPSVDIALFGRMAASNKNLNVDAAAQVAHAISTHTVHNEYDYFTAVDDCKANDKAGAAHMGTMEFNSSTLYRYAAIHVTELERSLHERTPEIVRAFVDAFIHSMPTGKINTCANNMPANAIYVTIRYDQPVNLVGAFEKPVREAGEGYVKPSAEALVKHTKNIYKYFLKEPAQAFVVGDALEELVDEAYRMSTDELLDAVEAAVKEVGGQA